MSGFGWSYPPGAEDAPSAPYNQTDEPCSDCGEWEDQCTCSECPECGEFGTSNCRCHS